MKFFQVFVFVFFKSLCQSCYAARNMTHCRYKFTLNLCQPNSFVLLIIGRSYYNQTEKLERNLREMSGYEEKLRNLKLEK